MNRRYFNQSIFFTVTLLLPEQTIPRNECLHHYLMKCCANESLCCSTACLLSMWGHGICSDSYHKSHTKMNVNSQGNQIRFEGGGEKSELGHLQLSCKLCLIQYLDDANLLEEVTDFLNRDFFTQSLDKNGVVVRVVLLTSCGRDQFREDVSNNLNLPFSRTKYNKNKTVI